jgi:hypothetical protein
MTETNQMEVEGDFPEEVPQNEEPAIKFRNYMPKTPSLLKGVQTRVTTEKVEKEIDGILDRNQRETWRRRSG